MTTLVSNYNTGDLGVSVDNGIVTLDCALNDYPRLSIVKYTKDKTVEPLGSRLNAAGLVFFLENISVKIPPIDSPNLVNEITYSYTHIAKKVFEYPINVYNFVKNSGAAVFNKTKDTYFYSIGSLISYATSQAGGGTIASPGFLVELAKNPSIEETVTIKQYIDDQTLVKGLVYQFSGATLGFTKLGAGAGIRGTIVSDITYGYGAIQGYKDSILTWSKSQNYDDSMLKKKLIRLDNDEYLIYEADYLPHLPPTELGNGIAPRDLSVMIDAAGITKQFKLTKYKWGQIAFELSGVFGYAHAALELVADPEKPNTQTNLILDQLTGNAAAAKNALFDVLGAVQAGKYGFPKTDGSDFSRSMVWRLVTIKETEYIYAAFNPNVSPVLKHSDGTLEAVTIAPNYERAIKSNLQVLVAEETRGWEIKRFAQEDALRWTSGSIDAWLRLQGLIAAPQSNISGDARVYYLQLYKAKVNLEQYLYRKIPIFERIDYAIEPYSKYYTDAEEVDWEVQYIPKSSLNEKQGEKDSTEVPVLFPDPNWQPALMVSARSRYQTSIGLSGNPNYNPQAANYFGSNPLTITTGSEEFEFTKYGILPSKSTKASVSGLYSSYTNVLDLLETISTSNNTPGMYYTPFANMSVYDYGLPNVSVPKIDTSKILGNFPNRIDSSKEDQYTTYTSVRSAKDHSYKNFVTTSNFTIADGRPPRAITRKAIYQDDPNVNETSPYLNTVTYVTSNLGGRENGYVSSISINGAQNINEAINGAKFKLQLDIITGGSSASTTLSFLDMPSYSIINGIANIPNGTWLVKKSTLTVQYSGGIPFAQPVAIECGLLSNIGISARTVQLANENGNADSVKVLINPILPSRFGAPEDSVPGNFSRWADVY